MARCTNCGAELGVGRFCTNCGARISAQPAEAPVLAAAPTPEDPAYPPPPPFPPTAPGHTPTGQPPTSHREPGRAVAPWAVAVLVLALAGSAALGTWLATRGSDGEPSGGGNVTGAPTSPASEPASPAPSSEERPDSGVNDVSETASVDGPQPIPAGRDLNGQPVTYPVENLVDDDPETAYRLPGDASGTVITFELADETSVRQVGLINGYTKTDSSGASTVDWYPLNRRVTRVEWAFDDGTTVEQTLDPDVRELQLLEVDDIATGSVQLTILEVSPPGTGPGARDVTAISDVLLLGV